MIFHHIRNRFLIKSENDFLLKSTFLVLVVQNSGLQLIIRAVKKIVTVEVSNEQSVKILLLLSLCNTHQSRKSILKTRVRLNVHRII